MIRHCCQTTTMIRRPTAFLRRTVAVTLVAAVSINTPELHADPATGSTARVDVRDLQLLVAELQGGAVESASGRRAARADIGILDLQRVLADAVRTEEPEDEADPAPGVQATLPCVTRLPMVASPGSDRILDLLLTHSDRREVVPIVEPPPGKSGSRERYRFHLTANAPPAGFESDCIGS